MQGEYNSNDKKKGGNQVAKILLVVFLVGAVVAGTVFVMQWRARSQAQKQYEELAESTTTEESSFGLVGEDIPVEDTTAAEPDETMGTDETVATDGTEAADTDMTGVPVPEKTVDFADLQANTNADIYAWIYIPDTKIDYPVLQHPTDNSYYLDYNIDGSKGYPGCIYSENYNTKDFTDPNTVLYGHNMKNGSMFSGLHKFKDSEYFETHPYIYIYTPDGMKVYQIFAAYEFSSSHLLLNFDLDNPDSFQMYLDGIMDRRDMGSNLRSDVELTSEDRILTLSTCIANKPENRYLVQGVLMNEE